MPGGASISPWCLVIGHFFFLFLLHTMPTIPEALAIAIEHHQAGRYRAAEEIYRQVLAVDANHADALHLLGLIALQAGNHEAAIELIRRAIEQAPGEALFHSNLGVAYKDRRQFDQAAACCRRALELQPDLADAHNHLGVVLQLQQQPREAIACFRRALELEPNRADAHFNLGNALKDLVQLSAAVMCYRRAVELKPDYAEAHNNLGHALWEVGDLDGARGCLRQALRHNPDYADAHSNLLFTLNYQPDTTPATLAAAYADYDRRYAAPRVEHAVSRGDVRRPLRLGFVSADLGNHPVGYFLVQGLEHLDRTRFATVCYSDRAIPGDRADRLQAAATLWRDVASLSDEQLTAAIVADRIDILFDLAGHSGRNRLRVFARKPAPVQITWLGSEGTTGLSTIDYVLADRYLIGAGEEPFYREQVLRMPDGYVCYDPPPQAPPAGPLPAAEKGMVTFGSFSNLAKINLQVIAVWSEILKRLPDARLMLKNRWLADAGVRKFVEDRFAACGVEVARLSLLGDSSYAEYLAAYEQVDVVLDPFPFSGSATTCDALWMGVPVITMPGATFVSRHSLSHLSTLGLTETIARSPEEYVELAVALAGDVPRLAALRAGLRGRMAASPVCDGKRFAAHLANVLETVWQCP